MQTLIQAIRKAEEALYFQSSAVNSVAVTETIRGNQFLYGFFLGSAKIGDTIINDDGSTSLVTHVISKDKRILKRGNHICPHQSQVLGRDLHGETILNNRGKKCLGYRISDAQIKKDAGVPYKYIVYSPGSPAFNWTAFVSLKEMIDFCCAYGLNLKLPTAEQMAAKGESENQFSFVIEIPEKVTFEPLTYSC